MRALGVAIALFSTAARADCVLPPGAQELVQRGNELRRKQDDAAGLPLFQRAWEESRCGRALAQVGLAEKALGRWVEAEAHLREALAATGEKWIEKYRRSLEAELATCAQKLGDLEVVFDGETPPGAELIVEGKAAALPLAQPRRVVAGIVAIVVRAPEHVPVSHMVLVPAGSRAREAVQLTRVPTVEKPPQPALHPPSSPAAQVSVPAPLAVRLRARRPAVLAVATATGAAGIGLLAGGTATAILARDRYLDLQASCGPDGDRCPPGSNSRRDEGRRMETASYVLLPLGVAALAVGVVTLALETRRPRLAALPLLSPGAAGLAFTGTF